jgi:hypothetical protein
MTEPVVKINELDLSSESRRNIAAKTMTLHLEVAGEVESRH